MLRSLNSLVDQSSSSSSSVYNYKTLNEMGTRPTSARILNQSSIKSNNKSNKNNRNLKKPLVDQCTHLNLPPVSNPISIQDVIIEGEWQLQENTIDHTKCKLLGIESLVLTCHDIMSRTQENMRLKQQEQRISFISWKLWSSIRFDAYRTLTDADRAVLNRAHIYDLMTIVFEAASTSGSISHLVSIWREASEHIKQRHPTTSLNQIKVSYENAFRHLIHTPDNSLLQIAVHASLLTSHSRMDLQNLGEQFGVKRNQFDVGLIRDSIQHFQDFIKFLREQKFKQEREQQTVDTNKLPYKPRKKRGLNANVSGTKFSAVRLASDVFGFAIGSESDFTTNMIWNDTLISMEIVSALKPFQKINHFPSMSEISRKDLLARNFDKLSRVLPDEYNYTPRTWVLPNEYNAWYSYASSKPKSDSIAYILKPNNGAMGHGIQVCCDYERIQSMDNYIVQEYIQNPYLIEGYKFDLRIYALVTSCDPLRLFIFNNGLVRMSTEKYEAANRKNASHLYMHLTNYSVNKYNVDYEISKSSTNAENTGSKRSLKYLFDYLRTQKEDANKLWKDIQNVVIKTVFLAQPHLFNAYRMCRPGASPSSESVCFELLGFDILIDQELKPWVLEVNRCPSFGTNEQIDFDIKMKLLLDTFELLRFRTLDRKKSLAIEKAEAQRRLYTNMGKTSRLFDDSALMVSNGNFSDLRSRQRKIADIKEKLYLLHREIARETFENRHLGDFIRLFPVEDSIRMSELMNLLTRCFDVLYTNKKDLSWSSKYYSRYKEDELLDQLAELEDLEQNDQNQNSRLAHSAPINKTPFSSWSAVNFTETINNLPVIDRGSPTASFASQCSDNADYEDDDENENECRLDSPPPSDLFSKASASTTTIKSNNSLIKKYASQSRTDISSTSISSLLLRKQRQSQCIPPTLPPKPPVNSSISRLNRLPDRKINPNESQSRLGARNVNNKSQMITYTTIIQTPRKPTNGRTTNLTLPKELQLSAEELNRLYQLILEQMHQLCIRYPHKTADETRRICHEVVENWNKYRSPIGEFWLSRLDAPKRQAIIRIVWTNVQQIIKQICTTDEPIEHLSLSKHLIKLEQRLLSNHGQCLWDICQNRHNSWSTTLMSNTVRLSPIELSCCNRFVELCKQALFVVYRYSTDEKTEKQRQQQTEGTTVTVIG
ncbi:unnamed protein product [Adineta ricciae]|uniref:Tubulin polyglutamylase TTLL7-like n=1 Tax=Adineta ricciae TaxID=249248 RepID=A0A815HFS8_ADIRI|nr:unnamed protein product [Adineta ricciae]